MSEAVARRRPRFCPDLPVRLADGATWAFPAPGQAGDPRRPSGPAYDRLIRATLEAERPADRPLAELCLAIFLLDWNYDLTPAEFAAALEGPGDPDRQARLRRDLGELARRHIDAYRDREAARWRSGQRPHSRVRIACAH